MDAIALNRIEYSSLLILRFPFKVIEASVLMIVWTVGGSAPLSCFNFSETSGIIDQYSMGRPVLPLV